MSTEVFISYSHADERPLERLHKHLAMLKREGIIRTWTDHELLPGAMIDAKIVSALEASGIFAALVSPDYLASNYCYEKEFQHAIRLSEAGRLIIIPIILEPCDWLSSPFSQFLALPKDGKPISEWANENNAFLDIVTGLRHLLSAARKGQEATEPSERVGARRPRVKQDFDTIQKREFADKAFETIQRYFEASCRELNAIGEGNLKARFEAMGGSAFTCTVVNRAKQRGGEAHITIRNGKGAGFFGGGISYVWQPHADNNISNGSIRVEADDYTLYLVNDNFATRGDRKSAPEQVAAALWIDFVKQAGVEYE